MLLFIVVWCVVFCLAYAGVGRGVWATLWTCGALGLCCFARFVVALGFVALLLLCLSGRILSDFGVALFSWWVWWLARSGFYVVGVKL